MAEKKKVALIGVSSLLLVAMVIGVTIGMKGSSSNGQSNGSSSGGDQISTSQKAVESICQPTDYREECVKSLSKAAGNSSDPKEIIKFAFTVSMDEINKAMTESQTFKELEKDPQYESAVKVCKEVMEHSIDDLQRSADEFGALEMSKISDYLEDLNIWLSGAIAFQETCLDAFENTTGDAGEKMKHVLKASGQMTHNALAIVTGLHSAIKDLKIPGLNRKLLSANENQLDADGFPTWVNPAQRRLLQAGGMVEPNVIVAQDGSGKYKTINEALKDIPAPVKGKTTNESFVIYVKAGIYKEYVTITKKMNNVVIIGDGPTKTKITGNRNFKGGYKTYHSSTFTVQGFGFVAKSIGFENTAGAIGHQAVALLVQSDRSVVYNCQMDGYQDTLYAHSHRQFYRDCTITGTVDYIFGDAAAIFQNCNLVVRLPGPDQQCIITAQGRKDERSLTGFVVQNCKITAAPEYLKSRTPKNAAFLARPWKDYSKTIFINSMIDGFIDPAGWLEWPGTTFHKTCYYAEIGNKGPGADVSKRVAWPGVKKLTPQQASEFTVAKFLEASGRDPWIKASGVPFDA